MSMSPHPRSGRTGRRPWLAVVIFALVLAYPVVLLAFDLPAEVVFSSAPAVVYLAIAAAGQINTASAHHAPTAAGQDAAVTTENGPSR
ncbi:hypothetical protein [Micromonospora sp. NPDC047074]|uniref:hypothetical protein n=1 Tax=Micromonospora sp. NPDC047074 TaxID=3154339 RepID=UPI00340B8B3F